MNPSATARETSSRFPMRASTTGSMKRAPGSDVASPPSHMPERGSGTDSSRRSTIASVVTPSDCAWKFVMMR